METSLHVPPRRILLPVDFSLPVAHLAPLARLLAARSEAELVLLHVTRDELCDEIRHLVDTYLDSEFAGLNVRRTLAQGDPATVITQHAAEADLVVMPTHGRSVFRRFLIGSVTAKVLDSADCPVLTGAHSQHAIPAGGLERILCALDLERTSVPALHYADWLSREFSAPLTIAHVLPPVEMAGVPYYDLNVWKHRAESGLKSLCEPIQPAPAIVIEVGKTADRMRAVAEATNADLLVIGRHHAAGIVGRLRSDGYAIIRDAPCAVLSV